MLYNQNNKVGNGSAEEERKKKLADDAAKRKADKLKRHNIQKRRPVSEDLACS